MGFIADSTATALTGAKKLPTAENGRLGGRLGRHVRGGLAECKLVGFSPSATDCLA